MQWVGQPTWRKLSLAATRQFLPARVRHRNEPCRTGDPSGSARATVDRKQRLHIAKASLIAPAAIRYHQLRTVAVAPLLGGAWRLNKRVLKRVLAVARR